MEEINIKELLQYIKEKVWIIGIALVLSLTASVIYTGVIKKPIYKSSTTYVLISDSSKEGITTSEVTLNEKLIVTYKEIIKSRNILEKVITTLNLDETPSSLAKTISVEQVSTSSMIKITVSNKDPEMAKKIAETIGYEFSKEVESLYKISNLGLVDKALVPTVAANESNKKEMILINGGGIALSLMVIFMLFYFDNTIKDQEQVQEKTNLPVLGNVPLVSKKKEGKEKDLIVHNDPKSPISEGLRTIRTNLQFSNVDKQMKKIMITSSMPGEGKSFTSANLATAFAQDGAKVIMLDCDMRKGRLHKIFEVSNAKGLSNLLIDNVEKNYKKYIKKTSIENLSIIPSGVIPPNPSELLNSEANKKLISILEEEYDYVIFDCVPINGLPDSLIMANLVNKAIIVCAANVTPTELLLKTKSSLENVDAEIAGIVINKTKGSYNKYYGHYYG
ncbi:MAG: polysaccharide biosynthesis tyrosine autokinase [Bacilli bacterium]